MKLYAILFLFFLISSSLTFAVSQNDIEAVDRINIDKNIIFDDVKYSDIVLDDNIIYTEETSLLKLPKTVSAVVYGEDATLKIENSNVNLSNIGIDKGIISIAGDNITGNFSITFYTIMPNTPFSIKHYEGVTDNKSLAQIEGETIIPLIYSDKFGTITYNDSRFSTQILSFPSTLEHKAGGDYTNYYLDYFFSSYDFVTLTQSGVFLINDSWSNYSQYEIYSPTDAYVRYQDSLIDVYFTGASKRLRLISKNYTSGFTKTVTVKAANNPSHSGEVSQSFTWKLNATNTSVYNKYPVQIAYIPNQTIPKNSRQTFYFNSYYTNYSDICMSFYNVSNYSQTGYGLSQSICVNMTLYQYDNITNSTIFLVDLNGLGNDISTAIYTNNTENVTLDVWYTAGKRNISGSVNFLNISNFYLTISGNAATSNSSYINNIVACYSGDVDGTDYQGNFNAKMNVGVTAANTTQYKVNKSFYINGATAGLNTSSTFCSSGKNCTISGWFYRANVAAAGVWFSNQQTSGQGFTVYAQSNAAFQIVGLGCGGGVGSVLNASYFHHGVMVYDNTNDKVYWYADGVNIANQTGCTDTAGSNFTFGVNPYDGSNDFSGYMDEIIIYDKVINASEVTRIYNSGDGLSCSNQSLLSYTVPQQTASLPNININLDDMVYLDYNDYFVGFDRIYINFTSPNGTNVSMYALLNSTSYKFNDSSHYILNLTGNGNIIRLYVTAGINTSYTLFNVSICNHEACLYVPQSLNISYKIITDVPVQTYHIDNIFMQLNDTHTENWGAYFSGYTALSISFVDLITSQNITILYYNVTANYTTSYLNITSFLNVVNVNTTFQSFDTQYYTVMLVEAINAYGSVGQYVNFNINYSYVPPPNTTSNETCIQKGVICLFPDYTTLTQKQMNMYVLFSVLITIILILFAFYKMLGEINILSTIVSIFVIVIELIYFVKIQYLPILYVVWLTISLIGVLFLLYKVMSK